jgi:hypothetical protein
MKKPSLAVAVSTLAFVLGLVAACADNTVATHPPSDPNAVPPDDDSGVTTTDDAAPGFDDGTPTRVACVGTLGSGLSPAHGRLDGTLVSIVGPTDRGCPTDPSHLHLQVKMGASVYDIAINLDGLEGETDAKLPGIPYAEGWHPMDLDYVGDLGLHSTNLTLTTPGAIRDRVVTALAKANHVSIFGTGYPGSDGAHIVHYKGAGLDGAIVVNPSAPTAHVIAFRFDNDTF